MGKAGAPSSSRTTASPPWSTKWKTSTAGYSGGERGERDHHDPPVPGQRSRRGSGSLRSSLGETSLLQRTPELFAWKHLDNPFGRSIILVAEAEGTIAGLRAFMRWELTTPRGETSAACGRWTQPPTPTSSGAGSSAGSPRRPSKRRREDGVDLVFNTPNEKSGAGYLQDGLARRSGRSV